MRHASLSILTAAMAVLITTAKVDAGPKGDSIVDVAIALNSSGDFEGFFDTLIQAVLVADPAVLATLDGNGQFTVFAPTDDAFAALGISKENVGDLDQAFLTDVLLYHVLRGRRDSEDILGSSKLRTLQRGFLDQEGGILTDNLGLESTIIVTDVMAANGIIHAVDSVVLPYEPAE